MMLVKHFEKVKFNDHHFINKLKHLLKKFKQIFLSHVFVQHYDQEKNDIFFLLRTVE